VSDNVPSFDIDDDEMPEVGTPENGVARKPEESTPPKARPTSHRRSGEDQGKENRTVVRAHDPPRDFAEGNNLKNPDRSSPKDVWPVEARALWLKILDWLPTQKIGERQATVDDVMIGVQRISGAGQTGPAMFPDPIEGASVAGDENESADAALMRVLTDTYHMPVADRRSRGTYRLKFYWRVGGKGDIKWSEPLTLDSPENIARVRLARKQIDPSTDVLSPAATTLADGRPIPAGSNIPPEVLLELGALRADKARAEGRPVDTVAVSSAKMAVQPADWEQRLKLERELAEARAAAKAAEDARKMAENHAAEKAELQRKLDALEAKQREEALNARLRALEERVSNPAPDASSLRQQILAELQAAGIIAVGPDGRPVPAHSYPPTSPAQQILDAVKVAADVRAAEEKTKAMLREAFGFADPQEGEQTGEKEDEPTLVGKFMKFIGSNMDTILAGGSVVVAAAADSLLQPNAAKVIKGALQAAQEQAARRQAAQTLRINPVGGAPSRAKPPSA
jgi:hypothetical protein